MTKNVNNGFLQTHSDIVTIVNTCLFASER